MQPVQRGERVEPDQTGNRGASTDAVAGTRCMGVAMDNIARPCSAPTSVGCDTYSSGRSAPNTEGRRRNMSASVVQRGVLRWSFCIVVVQRHDRPNAHAVPVRPNFQTAAKLLHALSHAGHADAQGGACRAAGLATCKDAVPRFL